MILAILLGNVLSLTTLRFFGPYAGIVVGILAGLILGSLSQLPWKREGVGSE